MTKQYNGLELAISAYSIMLKIPYDSALRLEAQSALCLARDYIAANTGRDAESVQNEFEAIAQGKPLA